MHLSPDLPEAIEPEPDMGNVTTPYEDRQHEFKAKPENATREKVYDCWGRWHWADGNIY